MISTCDKCNQCGKDPCGCREPVFSVEAMPDNPTLIRYNVNGKSVWYDHDSIVKAGETCTTVNIDAVARTFNYHGECSEQTISAKELGSILHLGDLGDVNADTITDNGILNYRKDGNCGEGCEGIGDGWVSSNPIEVGGTSLDYILGSDSEGRMASLMPPINASSFSYLTWAAQDKAVWKTINTVASIPDDGTYKYPLYLDPNSGEIVAVKEAI